jgi:hypothetical protein
MHDGGGHTSSTDTSSSSSFSDTSHSHSHGHSSHGSGPGSTWVGNDPFYSGSDNSSFRYGYGSGATRASGRSAATLTVINLIIVGVILMVIFFVHP